MKGRGVERKGCLVWSFTPTAVTIAAPQHVEADVPSAQGPIGTRVAQWRTGGKETSR